MSDPQVVPAGAPHGRSAAEVLAAHAGDARVGLTSVEARARLVREGPNELAAEPPEPAWRRFARQFRDPLVLLLLAATALSAGVWALERDTAIPYEAATILAIVLLNGGLGYLLEARAERALEELRELGAARARVLRDGRPQRVPAAELVPGDVLLVEEGDAIAADARVLESVELQTSEAALTGESLPVAKGEAAVAAEAPVAERTCMLYAGTVATYGRGRAVVVATGMRTEFGRIAQLLRLSPETATPFRRELDRTGRALGLAVLVIAAAIVATLLAVDGIDAPRELVDVLVLGVALAVAAVPEGLPAVVTAVLATGVRRMARRHAVVRDLAAVEAFGSVTVVATDKTGTLTKNEMTVRAVVTASGRAELTGSGYAPEGEVALHGDPGPREALAHELERALRAGDRACNAVLEERDGRWRVHGDPTEGALRVAARKAGLEPEGLERRFVRLAERPFSSERRLMSTVHLDTARRERRVVFAKGAPDVLLARCGHELVGATAVPLAPERRERILAHAADLGGRALRTLGLAFRSAPARPPAGGEELEHDLVFLGLVGMMDPPRPEAAEAVARAAASGIRSLIVTGDQPGTALAVAEAVGIPTAGGAVAGPEIDRLDDAALVRRVREVSVFARADPGHKLRIVRALQEGGEVVAVTGDGVNDAPALKAADIGVAMGVAGTDVAKEAADMVLADDNFATIVAAVEEGRAIFANVRKFLRFLLSSNLGEVLTMFLGIVLAGVVGLTVPGGGRIVPLLAPQILWINLVTDSGPALALGLEPPDEAQMARPPRRRGTPVVTAPMWRAIAAVGALMAAGTLLVLDLSLPGGLLAGAGEPAYGRTMAFHTLVLFQLFNVFNARADRRSAFRRPRPGRWLLLAVALSLAAQTLVLSLPAGRRAFGLTALGAADWAVCAAVAASVVVGLELVKGLGAALGRLRDGGPRRLR